VTPPDPSIPMEKLQGKAY